MGMEHYTRTTYQCDYKGCSAAGRTPEERGLGDAGSGFTSLMIHIPGEMTPRHSVLCDQHWKELLGALEVFGFKRTDTGLWGTK